MLALRIMQALDGTDTRLLSALARDPKRTVVALAQKLGLSRNTVQARMAQLEKKHVFLSFERRINPAALGYPLMAFISVHVQQQKLGQLAVDLAGIPEILEGYGLTGSADCCCGWWRWTRRTFSGSTARSWPVKGWTGRTQRLPWESSSRSASSRCWSAAPPKDWNSWAWGYRLGSQLNEPRP